MSDSYKLNIFTGKKDLTEHIPQVDADPSTPRNEDSWVRKSAGPSYHYSYRTTDGTTKRLVMS